ncbi:MAG: DUF2156 domain-containing protein [Candidatus Omnitrophica bacterium]|nr:DUF2156 domain-containing protein [Candidatus Omnitrophota bacterium]
MDLKTLTLADRPLIQRFLKKTPHVLSSYTFANIYIWKALYNVRWATIRGCLCIFFQDAFGWFLYLPPLGSKLNEGAVAEAFDFMDRCNKNDDMSRIENVEENQADFFEQSGYLCRQKPGEYLYLRQAMAQLRGNALKHKRASVNFFRKHSSYEYIPFEKRNRADCLSVYDQWMRERASHCADALYQGMLKDSLATLQLALRAHKALQLVGRVVKVDGRIKAFTFGMPINKTMFCILYEIADLSVKGLSQFIFSAFCDELKSYTYINAMDDSGLASLERVKRSYQPTHILTNTIVTRHVH